MKTKLAVGAIPAVYKVETDAFHVTPLVFHVLPEEEVLVIAFGETVPPAVVFVPILTTNALLTFNLPPNETSFNTKRRSFIDTSVVKLLIPNIAADGIDPAA